MKQKETRRNNAIHQPRYVLVIENVLSPSVLNTEEGGEQRDLRPGYNSSSQQNISGQTETSSTHKPQISSRSSTHTNQSCRDFSKVFRHLKMQMCTAREPTALDNGWPHAAGNQHTEKHDSQLKE